MTATCPACGRPVRPEARFCGGCGSALATAAAASSPVVVTPPPGIAAPNALEGRGDRAPVTPEQDKGFSPGRMLKFGWRTTWDNLGPVAGVFALALLIWIVGWVAVALALQPVLPDWAAGLLTLLVFVALGAIVTLGLCSVALRWADGERGGFADLFSAASAVIPFILASLLYLLIVAAGILLLVFPGIVWGLAFSMYPFLMVEKGLGPVAALKESARLTSGAKWDLFALALILQYVLLIGAYALLIGLFVAVPIAMLAWAMSYRWLEQRTPAQ